MNDEREFIKAAMRGLLSNPSVVKGKTINIDDITQLAHRIGTEQFKRLHPEKSKN